MRQNSELRRFARTALTGNWLTGALIMIVYMAIIGCVSGLSNVRFLRFFGIIMILLYPIIYGVYISFLNLARGEKLEVATLFEGFNDYGRILGTVLLFSVYVMLWSFLIIIPGIIKFYSYSMTFYILKDKPELKFNGAIERSMAMMRGHKMDLFLLDLSFIGWIILSIITCGIGFLFLTPYMLTARAAFYEDLKAEYETSPIEAVEE